VSQFEFVHPTRVDQSPRSMLGQNGVCEVAHVGGTSAARTAKGISVPPHERIGVHNRQELDHLTN